MPIFKVKNSKLTEIKEKRIELERDIQRITEQNLNTVLGCEFVSSEFSLNSSRIDTLAFDKESSSFVIIEYKKDKNFSVIDQGFSYLAQMLSNKADFILEYNEKINHNLKREDVDWSQTKVLFISPSFTGYQRGAIEFKDLPIELWEVKLFDNDTILYNELKPLSTSESIKSISKNKTITEVSKEIKEYTVNDLFKSSWRQSLSIFEELREKIITLDNRIEEKINKHYIGYRIGYYNVVGISPYKSKIKFNLFRLDTEDLQDPEKKLMKRPWKRLGWGKSCSYEIYSVKDIDYAIYLTRQVLEKLYR